jgi:hypothetical protein
MATTDQALMQQIQYALLEPPDGGQNWPSQLWTRDEVIARCNERQNRLLHETMLLIGIANIAVLASTHRIALPSDHMRTASVVWRGSDGTVRELLRSDSFEADHAMPTWELTDTTYPLVYMDEETPSGFFQIGPAPSVAGTIELLYIPLGTTLNGAGEILVVPDEFMPSVKYGALIDLLRKDGRGQDLAKAEYAEQRYQLGVDAAKIILNGWTS